MTDEFVPFTERSFGDLVRIARAWQLEYAAFLAYQHEKQGETHTHGRVDYHNVRPTDVARTEAVWAARLAELRALVTPEEMRDYLQRKATRNGARRRMGLSMIRRSA